MFDKNLVLSILYFDIDSEQVFWICTHNLEPLSIAIRKMIRELS